MTDPLRSIRSRLGDFCGDVGAVENSDTPGENVLYKAMRSLQWSRLYGQPISKEPTISNLIVPQDFDEAQMIEKLIPELNAHSAEWYADRNVARPLIGDARLARSVMKMFADYVEENYSRSRYYGGTGRCFAAVQDFTRMFHASYNANQASYGKLRENPIFGRAVYGQYPTAWVPSLIKEPEFWGLVRLDIYDPRKAPRGSLVILNPFGKNPDQEPNRATRDAKGNIIPEQFLGGYRTYGTGHPRAGDIAVSLGNGTGRNDHLTTYSDRPSATASEWKPNNTYLAGVWAPAGAY